MNIETSVDGANNCHVLPHSFLSFVWDRSCFLTLEKNLVLPASRDDKGHKRKDKRGLFLTPSMLFMEQTTCLREREREGGEDDS